MKLGFLKKIYLLPSNIYNYVLVKMKNMNVGKNVTIRGRLKILGSGHIIIDDFVTINSSLFANPVGGGNGQTILYVINDSTLSIGKNVGISNSIICCTNGVSIGKYTKIGGGCGIYDTDFHTLDHYGRRQQIETEIRSEPIVIGDDVFIGANSIILKGVRIGDRAIVGAGSVVTKPIPQDELWAGNPARFIRKIST